MQSLMNAQVRAAISFTVSFVASSFSINVSCSGAGTAFKFLTDDQITSSLYVHRWLNFDPANTKSANDILKINTPMEYVPAGEPFQSDFISTQPIYNIYSIS